MRRQLSERAATTNGLVLEDAAPVSVRTPFRRIGLRYDEMTNLAIFTVLFAVALLPVLLTPIPAMVDYVNHLARMHVIADAGTPEASPFYRVTWALYPNLAMDLLVPRLARVMSVELATRLFLLASQILVVTGAVAIELAVKRRFQIAGHCALMVLYSVPFAWGFLNFEFALGLALWGIACWMRLSARPLAGRLAMHALFVALLFVSHLFALGLYGATLGIHELWRARSRPLTDTILTMAALAAPAFVAVESMAATGGSVGQSGNSWFMAMKPVWFFMILNGYSLLFSAIAMIALIVLAWTLVKRHALRFEASGAWLVIGLLALYVAIPSRLLDTSFIDIRVLVAAALIVPAFLTITFPSDTWRLGAAAMAAGLTLTSVGLTQRVWASYDSDYRDLIASFGSLEKGAKVLVGHSGESQDPPLRDLIDYPIYHAPTLAVHYAQAFVPTLFTTVGKQPIAPKSEVERLAFSCGGPVPMAILKAIAQGHVPDGTPDFVSRWTRDFDYLYVVGPSIPNPMPDMLTPMRVSARFTLYRIKR